MFLFFAKLKTKIGDFSLGR